VLVSTNCPSEASLGVYIYKIAPYTHWSTVPIEVDFGSDPGRLIISGEKSNHLQLPYRNHFLTSDVIHATFPKWSREGWQNIVAAAFKRLHKPGDPVIVVNLWDASSAEAAASVPGVKALATASKTTT
jgi:hypothetical protein